MKTLVINELKRSQRPTGCSSWFASFDEVDVLRSDLTKWEVQLSRSLNSIGEQGYSLKEERVCGHGILDNTDGYPQRNRGSHGVFIFNNHDKPVNYRVYMGPIIQLPRENTGCASISFPGCNRGEKSKGCNMAGCKKDKMGALGCKKAPHTTEQLINFYNKKHNSQTVNAINQYNGWRTDYLPERDDNVISSFDISNELVSIYWNAIQQQVDRDLAEIYNSGLGYIKDIAIPSESPEFTQGLLFSSESSTKVIITRTFSLQVFLSGFEILYLKIERSLMDWAKHSIDIVLNMFKSKKDKVDRNILNEKNIAELQSIYDKDLERQSDTLHAIDNTKNAMIGKLMVTFAVPKKESGFLGRIFGNNASDYDFIRTEIDLNQK